MGNDDRNETYHDAVQRLREQILVQRSEAASPLDAARTSANLFHLLPRVPVIEHDEMLRHIYFNQRRAHIDQFHLDALVPNITEHGDEMSRVLDGGESILCAYHYGAYRLLLPYALSRGVKVSMLIDHRVAQTQGGDFQEILMRFCVQRGIPAENFRIRDTSKPSMLLSLLRDIRAGYTVLVFLDGNIGADRETGESGHTVPVPFMGATLHSRSGVAVLSHLARCPIVPLLTPRDDQCLWATRLEVHAPIVPGDEDRDTYVRRASAAMWTPLENTLRANPLLWESWRYVDRSLDLPQLESSHRTSLLDTDPAWVTLDDTRYALTDDTAEPALFDRLTYRMRTISPAMFAFLQQFRGAIRPREYGLAQPKMTPDAWRNLVKLGVLKAAAL